MVVTENKITNKMLQNLARDFVPVTLKKDILLYYGDSSDGVIEFPILTENGIAEVGSYFGEDKEKNIIGISPQIGCPAKCNFCEYGPTSFSRNLGAMEMYEQVMLMLQEMDKQGIDIVTKKLKVSIARSGDPFFNKHLVEGMEEIGKLGASFKVSTVFPDNRNCYKILEQIANFDSRYKEPVQLQVSLISTSEDYRRSAAGIKVASFKKIREAAETFREISPNGRKVNLSLILSEKVPSKVEYVREIFPPDLFHFRFRNYVPTQNGRKNNLETITQEKMEEIKDSYRQEGYEVDNWATPTPTELAFSLAANVTLNRYKKMKAGLI